MLLAAVLPSGKDVTAYSLTGPLSQGRRDRESMSSAESRLQPDGQTPLDKDGVGVQAALTKAFVEINNSEDCLRTILDTIPAQAWSLRPNGNIDYINQRWHDYTGISRAEAFRCHREGQAEGQVAVTDLAPVVVHPDDAPSAAKWRQE